MSLETLSPKQSNELERCVEELLSVMRKTRVLDEPLVEPLVEPLKLLAHELGEARRERFDKADSEYRGY